MSKMTSQLLGQNNLCRIETGGTPSTMIGRYWENGTIPWMESGDIHKKRVRETTRYITQEGYDNSNAKYLPENSVLVALAGQGKTRGTVAISELVLTTNQSVAAIIPNKEKLDANYLYYFLHNQYEKLRNHSAGAGRAGLSKKLLLDFSIKFPPLPDQRNISDILTTADTLIEKTEDEIGKKELVRKGLMAEAFSPEMNKSISWDKATLDSILKRIIDYRGKTPRKTEFGVPLITAKNVRMGFVDPEPREFIAERDFDSWMTRGLPVPSDVLFTTEAPLGNVAQIDTKDMIAFAQRVIVLQPNSAILPAFLMYLLMSDKVQRAILRLASGSTVLGIKQSTFRKIGVEYPKDLFYQRNIVDRIKAVEGDIDVEKNYLFKLRTIKSGLMERLLN